MSIVDVSPINLTYQYVPGKSAVLLGVTRHVTGCRNCVLCKPFFDHLAATPEVTVILLRLSEENKIDDTDNLRIKETYAG